MTKTLWRKALAEFVGTALLVIAVIGSGIAAQTLSPNAVVAIGVIRVLWPAIETVSQDVVVPHEAPDVQMAGAAR